MPRGVYLEVSRLFYLSRRNVAVAAGIFSEIALMIFLRLMEY